MLVVTFKTLPKLIIYDNACKLHLYYLKREPKHYENTKLSESVDRIISNRSSALQKSEEALKW